jgi:GNAT superfamily N-acetyltransferase
MGSMPVDELSSGKKVKSIFCFAITPEMKRKGIAKMLLERVCQDAAKEGFDFVEAYPNKMFINDEDDFMGPAELFRQKDFTVYREIENRLVQEPGWFSNKSCKMLRILPFSAEFVQKLKFLNNSNKLVMRRQLKSPNNQHTSP